MAIKDRKPIFEIDADLTRAANFLHPFKVELTSVISGLATFEDAVYIDSRYFQGPVGSANNTIIVDERDAVTNAGYFIPSAVNGGGSSFEPAQAILTGIADPRFTYVYQPNTIYIDGWYNGKIQFLKHLIKFKLSNVTGDPMGIPQGQWLLDAWTNIRTFPSANATDDKYGLVQVRLVNFHQLFNGLDFFHERTPTSDPFPFYEKSWGL